MSEDRLQYECVKWFRNAFPEHRGALFEVNNKTNKGAHRKGLGTVRGVSDLLFYTTNSEMIAIELKTQDSRHEVDHIERQLEWGKLIKSRGGESIFIFDLEQFKSFMNEVCNSDDLTKSIIMITAFSSRNYIEGVILRGRAKGLKTVKLNYNV